MLAFIEKLLGCFDSTIAAGCGKCFNFIDLIEVRLEQPKKSAVSMFLGGVIRMIELPGTEKIISKSLSPDI